MRIEIPDDCLSELVKASLPKTIERAKHAHYTNVVLRINGEDVTVEADWIKYMKIAPERGELGPLTINEDAFKDY